MAVVGRRQFRVVVDGRTYWVSVEEVGDIPAAPAEPAAVPVTAGPEAAPPAPVPPPAAAAPKRPAGGAAVVSAPLPGTVLEVKTAVGEAVEPGQVLVILEAMKMENEIVAPRRGVVTAVHVTKGAGVGVNDPLVEIE
ncbi:MAG: acetyl-CoA carboxylase biotin carboxyl carrier protein subunit [Actinomycetia bacterium]|nr:acetyl-CoA carboxylase biotin carboxyl carrier protein subunit [Actinomycetes bacterium]